MPLMMVIGIKLHEYLAKKIQFRLYEMGNKAIYKVNFDFSNNNPFRIAVENTSNYVNTYSPDIKMA